MAAAPHDPDASPRRRTALRVALILYAIAFAVGTHLPGVVIVVETPTLIQIDKIIHFCGFAGLAALLFANLPPRARCGARVVIHPLAALGLLGYALVDEYTQRWVGRTIDEGDVIANALGILAVYLLVAAPSGLTRWPSFLVTAARSLWLAIVPAATLVAITPQAGALLRRLDPQRQWWFADDKQGHFVCAMVFTWLLAMACPGTRAKARLSVGITLALMLLSAAPIEWAQAALGRGTPEPADAAAHYRGVLVALGVWAGLAGFIAPLWNALLDQLGRPTLEQLARPRLVAFDPSKDARFVGHAALVSGLTLLSRITGLVRDAVLAAVFGLGLVADAFAVGFLIPNLFRRLFGEGALTASFIPHYSDLLRKDPQLARRFASLCVALLVVVLGAITVAGQFALGALLAEGGWDQRGTLAIRLVMVMLPYMPLVCLVALLGGLLQVHRKFGPAANAPILLNLIIIAFAAWAGLDAGADDIEAQTSVAFIVGGAVIVAGLIQVGYLLIATQRVTRLTWRVSGAGPTLRRMLWMMVPMVLGLAVFQINSLLDILIAMWLSPGQRGLTPAQPILGLFDQYPMRLGDIAALGWAQRLYQFPLGVFGIAIATAIFPALAGAVIDTPAPAPGKNGVASPDASGGVSGGSGGASGGAEPGPNFAATLRQGLRLTVFIGLPASVGLLLVREPLTSLIYQRANFSAEDARRVAAILLGYAPAIWAYSMTHVLTRAFHALKDANTPLKVSLGMVALNFALNMVLVWPLGAQGLATSTATTAVIQCGVLILLIRRRVMVPIDRPVVLSWARTAIASAIMGAALVAPLLFFPPRGADTLHQAGLVATMTLGGAAVYLLAARLLGCEELTWLKRRRG
jgi:putative peptidoglycan lipid II flippase